MREDEEDQGAYHAEAAAEDKGLAVVVVVHCSLKS